MRRSRPLMLLTVVAMLASLGAAPAAAAPSVPVMFTILHTNDFHGQLEEVLATPSTSSNPGMARVATVVKGVEDANDVLGRATLLVDAGDEMQGSLLSNLQKGEPTIAVYKAMGYDVATFGNHEFDWGQGVLKDRTTQADYPYVTANIVQNDTGNCATAGWIKPDFAANPYEIKTVGTAPNDVQVGFIGVTTPETPTITIASATAGLCFKDAADSIVHYYDEMKAAGADVIVVLSHLGYTDGGYGYGLPVYGDQTLATKLNTAGKPVNLIIGGHSHTNLEFATTVGTTKVVQAHYNGRKVGRADVTVNLDGSVNVAWTRLTVYASNTPTPTPEDATIKNLITTYSSNAAYQTLINTEIGWTNVPIARNYDGDSLMGSFVNDALYNDLNTDLTPDNNVDMFFNNSGGLRADISCAAYPCMLTYGSMFNILPFGNVTVVGTMTGAQILEVLNQAASLNKGAIQVAGIRYKFFNYRVVTAPGTPPTYRAWSWGAYDACVIDKGDGSCVPLDLAKTYSVGTNEFLAPAGGDNFSGFKYMKGVTYWGDMLNLVNDWVSKTYTFATPFAGALDGRITRDGDGDDTYDTGEIVPVTILHHNDSHGNLDKTVVSPTITYAGYTQLATLIKQEKAFNPDRTLLLSGGDNIQGDAMSYYFKSAPTGFAADGTEIVDPTLHIQPLIKAFNAMGYDAMDLGNHEFNFGSKIFKAVLGQATFPLLGANVSETAVGGSLYGIGAVGVQPYVVKTVGPEAIKVAILGITNHRVPNYELPSNIPGLTFSDPLAKAQELSDLLRSSNDAVVALTHIGFTEDPKSVEVDKNVDTNMAATVSGLDAIVGSHSHTNPQYGFGAYKYLPTIVADPDGKPVIINQAYRYNNTLGEIFLGFRPKTGGGYELVSRAGQYLSVVPSGASATPEDPDTKAIIKPYADLLVAYNNTLVGQTTAPIDTTNAYIAETNAANLQADASVWELANKGIPAVDIHISGAMTRPSSQDNWVMFKTATPANPATVKVSDMFTLMPYENSLVVLNMNGPQIKRVLERAYRNYYYYKYQAANNYGGYSYYTTCMLDTNFGGQVTYNDLYPAAYDPAKTYVVSLKLPGGRMVDFADASTYFNVSTVNYLAAGSCNFNDSGVSLWPLDQIVADTQFYVRDAVIDYITAMGTVSPAIEGRLNFVSINDTEAPVITITAPEATAYLHTGSLTLDFAATDSNAGVAAIWAYLDGTAVVDGQVVDLLTLSLGDHTLTVRAVDRAGNAATASVTFTVKATAGSLKTLVNRFYAEGKITKAAIRDSLLAQLTSAQASIAAGKNKTAINQLNAFINLVKAQSGKAITAPAAVLLIADAKYLIGTLK